MPEYPGLGLPLRHFPQGDYNVYPLGAHGNCYGGDSDLLPVREVAMMAVMDKLMDKPDWHKKVFDEGIVEKWRKDALEYPDDEFWKLATGGKVNTRWAHNADAESHMLWNIKPLPGIMSSESFDQCVRELRAKASYYEKTGLIPTLDACATVVKSDTIVSSQLQEQLRSAFDKLMAEQKASPDWHPKSGDLVQDLLHPSMYPLVYGCSRVLKEELVGVHDAIDKWAGKGEVIAKGVDAAGHGSYGVGGNAVPPNFWSDTYQWLPSNVAFQDDNSVKFTSYINGLHPNKHPEIYKTIERLVETALPAWDQCLGLSTGYNKVIAAGRVNSRFRKPENPDDENLENWDPSDPKAFDSAKNSGDNKDDDGSAEIDLDATEEADEEEEAEEDEEDTEWHKCRKAVQPQPDLFDYPEDYYVPDEDALLSKEFKDSGLQIIVKMASIELTPEKPEFPAGGWHVEGQMNERICATALYYLDSTNISPSNLSFRMQTSAYMQDEYDISQDGYHWMQEVYGTSLGGGNMPCLQNYGSVETLEGRLLAFPNVFQHRVSPFRLTDPSKPGHRRFIALWLVDPHARIISTANVPPQVQDWFVESAFSDASGSKAAALSKLPAELVMLLKENGVDVGETKSKMDEEGKLSPELMQLIREYFNAGGNGWMMSEEEAKRHREKIVEVRSAFHLSADDEWHQHSYSFCEH